MPFLIDKSKAKTFNFSMSPLPIETFKNWLLAHLLRSKKYSNSSTEVDFNSDPLFVVFNVEDASSLIDNVGNSGADHIGFFFGANKGQKFQNMTCFMSLTKKIADNKFEIVPLLNPSVYEGGDNGSSSAKEYDYKINNYKGRINKLRDPKYNDEFGSYERNGVHYPINDFKKFIESLPKLDNKGQFKSFFVKRTDTSTTTLVHSPFNFDLSNVLYSTRSNDNEEVFDQGTGCCPI